MSSISFSWFVWVSVAADLAGLIGGSLLAWAFLVGRRQMDTLASIGGDTSPDPQNAAEFKRSIAELRREVVAHLGRRYTTVQVGAWMIVVAFFIRIVSTIYS
jgi:hypothetical protein